MKYFSSLYSVESSKCGKYLGKIADVTVTVGGFVGGLGPMAKGIGSAAGILVKEMVNKVEKNVKHKRKHNSAKVIEHIV